MTLAEPDGHEAFDPDLNQPSAWCEGQVGSKIEPVVGNVFTLPEDAALVVVKAGAGEYANTIFINPVAGQSVWADTNGNLIYDPGGQGGDKDISHVIVCPVLETPTPTPTPTPTLTPTPTPTPTPTAPSETPTNTPPPTTPAPSPTPSESVTETPVPAHEPVLPATGAGIELVVLVAATAVTATGWAVRRWTHR